MAIRFKGSGPPDGFWRSLFGLGLWVVASSLPFFLASCGEDGGVVDEGLLASMLVAEDARGAGPEGLGPILEGLHSTDPGVQIVAVRALGRLEDPGQIEAITGLLSAADPDVRAEAINALGQAVFGQDGDGVGDLLLEFLEGETDAGVRGVVGRTLGRLRYAQPRGIRSAEDALRGLTRDGTPGAGITALLGAVLGLESLARQNRGRALAPETITRLEELTSYGLPEAEQGTPAFEGAARIRRVAVLALTAAAAVREGPIIGLISDPDEDVRRLAVAALGRFASSEEATEALAGALADPSPRVRIQAVGSFAARASEERRCAGLLGAASDPHSLVAVAALDLLGQPCPDPDPQIETLSAFVQDPVAQSSTGWHRGAHALVALAGVSPERASSLIPLFVDHVSPFARAYVARTATQTGDWDVLETLAGDENPNVRTAAVQGLFRLRGHEADGVLRAQLEQDDPQLLLTVAGLLEGTPDPAAAKPLLLEAFLRISNTGWETLRDPRMALLERLGEVVGEQASVDPAAGLEPYLSDFDPLVADRVAGLLTEWRGERYQAFPKPAPSLPLPSKAELDELARSRVILEMEGGGEIQFRLFPHLAPTNAARFARLAESGTLDGLTFHRVVANFVLQGGSPNANEMAGHGAYTRDETGLQSNWRGTVGTSTRGRDTGDGQFFINLVDNLRLDHNYSIFGEVVAGMDVVDHVVEGQKILRARVETP